jgi:predicted enzyme related to lactoylglutathione lyase
MNAINALNWFEIPVTDLTRASQFYGAVLKQTLTKQPFGPHELMIFAYQQPGVGGCLIQAEAYQPSMQGAVIYLPVSDNMDAALQRVTAAGGLVSVGRTALPGDMGCYAHIIDTEDNRVGLHAMK